MLDRIKSFLKELGIDFLSFAYSISNTALYGASFLRFMQSLSSKCNDSESCSKGLTIINYIAMSIFFISSFCTFSESNQALFEQRFTSRWSKIKGVVRNALSVPSSIIKTVVGSASLFTSVKNNIGTWCSGALSIVSGIFSFPSQFSLLGKMVKKEDKQETFPRNLELNSVLLGEEKAGIDSVSDSSAKYILIHLSTFFYSLSNTAIYYNSLINLPKELGIMSRSLSPSDEPLEQFFYSLICISSLFSMLSTHFSYAHLTENTAGLIDKESKTWQKAKDIIKKITGAPNAIAKISDSSIENFLLLQNFLSTPTNVAFTTISGISGLLTQFSILYSDPLKETSSKQEKPNLVYTKL